MIDFESLIRRYMEYVYEHESMPYIPYAYDEAFTDEERAWMEAAYMRILIENGEIKDGLRDQTD